MRSVALLGSTGSIGRQSLEIIRSLGCGVSSLAAGSNINLLEEQAREFKPAIAAVWDEARARELKLRLADTETRVLSGMEGLIEAASEPRSDTVITAVSGSVGLKPTLAAISEKKRIALANKETLVCAGTLVMCAVREAGAELLPVDSEHSAIFQCLEGRQEPRRILLTASGGPFRGMSREQTYNKTRADALKHPNWSMGAKITVDSATMMNKGLEVIEAMHLFGVSRGQIQVLVHPQSIVHSMVEFADGSVIAQLGAPDMRLPIQYALTWPKRERSIAPPLDLFSAPPLSFQEPDREAFPCLKLADEAIARGGTACAVMNAANEEAVALFLRDKLRFGEISECVGEIMSRVTTVPEPGLWEILDSEREARALVAARYGSPENGRF